MSEATKRTVRLRIGKSELPMDPDGCTAAGVILNPHPSLTGDQGLLQARIYEALLANGVELNQQDDVYPWLLDHLARQLGIDDVQLMAGRCPGRSVPCAVCGGELTQADFDAKSVSILGGTVATFAHGFHFSTRDGKHVPDGAANRRRFEAAHEEAAARHLESPTGRRRAV